MPSLLLSQLCSARSVSCSVVPLWPPRQLVPCARRVPVPCKIQIQIQIQQCHSCLDHKLCCTLCARTHCRLLLLVLLAAPPNSLQEYLHRQSDFKVLMLHWQFKSNSLVKGLAESRSKYTQWLDHLTVSDHCLFQPSDEISTLR